ncbi:MAG: FkbM family methyltransferase [Polyangiaceae bacterium]
MVRTRSAERPTSIGGPPRKELHGANSHQEGHAHGAAGPEGPVSTILDVGTRECTWDLIVHYPDVHHVLFEPLVEFRSAITSAYANIRHDLVQVAVSDRTGESALAIGAVSPGMAVSHSWLRHGDAADSDRVVPTVTLDDYVRSTRPAEPFLLKIDVDGEESRVLRGAFEILPRCSIVIVEVAVDEIVPRLSAVQERGFRLFDLTEPCYYDGALWQCDAVLVREDLFLTHFPQYTLDFDHSKYEMFMG